MEDLPPKFCLRLVNSGQSGWEQVSQGNVALRQRVNQEPELFAALQDMKKTK